MKMYSKEEANIVVEKFMYLTEDEIFCIFQLIAENPIDFMIVILSVYFIKGFKEKRLKDIIDVNTLCMHLDEFGIIPERVFKSAFQEVKDFWINTEGKDEEKCY